MPAGSYCSQIIDPDFRPVMLDGRLSAIRSVLFGTTSEILGTNCRLHQFMTIMHAERRLDPFFAASDPRITYLNDRQVMDFQFGLHQESYGEYPGFFEITPLDAWNAEHLGSTSRQTYAILVNIANKTVYFNEGPTKQEFVYPSLNDLMDEPLTISFGKFLPMQIRVQLLQELDDELESGAASFMFELTAPPRKPLIEVLTEIVEKYPQQLADMMKKTPADEHGDTVRSLVEDADAFHPRMAGVLAVVARYTEALRAQRITS